VVKFATAFCPASKTTVTSAVSRSIMVANWVTSDRLPGWAWASRGDAAVAGDDRGEPDQAQVGAFLLGLAHSHVPTTDKLQAADGASTP